MSGRARRAAARVGLWSVVVVVAATVHVGAGPAHAQVDCDPASRPAYADRDLLHADLSGQSLRCADFSRTRLLQANLSASDLTGALFDGADLTQARLDGSVLVGARFTAAGLSQLQAQGVDATGADFSDASMAQADLTGAGLSGARLRGVSGLAAVFTRADLRGADLTGATLTGARFDGADLTGASLDGVELTGADFTGAVGAPAAPSGVRIPSFPSGGERPAGVPDITQSDDVEDTPITLEFKPRSPALIAAGAAGFVLWALLVLAIALFRGDQRPDPDPPHTDLGPEPPAVVNLLAHRFRVTPDAVPATVLDLAARRAIFIEQIGLGSYVCRTEGDRSQPFSKYEERVLVLLDRRAVDGVVPTAALTTGPAEESSRWRHSFRKEVTADSKSRGLTVDFWAPSLVGALFVLALIPGGLVALGLGRYIIEYWQVAGTAGFFLLLFLGALLGSLRQKGTPVGCRVASRWLGLREYLEETTTFADLPPAAVAVWDRYLAHGAALGVAAAAVRAIPMGAEDDNRAWTPYGGHWHQVRVRYPATRPWGWHPMAAVFAALPIAAVAAGFWMLARSVEVQSTPADVERWIDLVRLGLAVVGTLLAVWAAVMFFRGVGDAFTTRTVRGEVVRRRKRGDDDNPRYYVAVDDGRSEKVRAWRVTRDSYFKCEQGQVVDAVVTRSLGYVRDIRRVTAPVSSAAPGA